MKCDEFETQLHEVLDRRMPLADDSLLALHARSCSACCRKMRLYEVLFEGLELAETPPLAANFGQQISRTARVTRPRQLAWVGSLSLAVAASLLVMVAVSVRIGNRGGLAPEDSHLAESNALEEVPAAEAAAPLQPRFRNRSRRGTGNLALFTAPSQPTLEANAAESLAANSPDFEGLIHQWQLASQSLTLAETSAATSRLPGLRPLASSLTTGFSALRQTLPGGRSESTVPEKPQANTLSAADVSHA